METEPINGVNVLFVPAEGPLLASEQDALDLIGATYGAEVDAVAIPAGRFAPDVFDLSTRMAGLFIQKFQNYRLRLFVLGDIAAFTSRSTALADFVGETNRLGHHGFFPDRAALAASLAGRP